MTLYCLTINSQWTIILATGLAAIATFAVVISSVQLQNAFGSSAEAREAWDKTNTLEAKLLIAYGYLVRYIIVQYPHLSFPLSLSFLHSSTMVKYLTDVYFPSVPASSQTVRLRSPRWSNRNIFIGDDSICELASLLKFDLIRSRTSN